MNALAIKTATGWRPIGAQLAPITRETLQLNHQGWWMKNASARRAFEDEQIARIKEGRS